MKAARRPRVPEHLQRLVRQAGVENGLPDDHSRQADARRADPQLV
jgi:hypothetical protein